MLAEEFAICWREIEHIQSKKECAKKAFERAWNYIDVERRIASGMTTLQAVKDEVRPSFEFHVSFVDKFLNGIGLDMGCGNCPLDKDNCIHVDVSPQPLAEEQVGKENVILADALHYQPESKVDYIFSSHMVEDLPTREKIIECLNGWSVFLNDSGYIVLLMPNMEDGLYPRVGEAGGNPSHKVDVGPKYIQGLESDLKRLKIIQSNTLPPEKTSTFDVVFQRTDEKV